MARSSKSAWLDGPGDLKEADVEDVPVKGESVRVRGLPAAYSNQASSEALEFQAGPRGDQTATMNTGRMEILQFAHGVIDPTFTVEEAQKVAERFGPAFKKVIAKIDELSGVDKEAIEEASSRFQASGADSNGSDVGDGTPAGSDGSNVRARAGAATRDDG